MRLSISFALLALFLLAAACSSSGSSPSDEPAPDVQSEDGRDFDDLPAPEGDVPAVDVADPAPDVPSEPDEAEEPEVVVPEGICDQPGLAACQATSEKPTTTNEIQSFAKNNALRLRCAEAAGGWDFSIFLQEFQGQQAFFMGEVHGSNEIGPASADLFEYLVRHAGVRVLALEIGMDTTAALTHFLKTGAESDMKEIGADMYGDNMFRRLLPERAHQLYLEGFDLAIVGVDVPQRLAWVNEELESLAEGLPEASATLLLADMPPPREIASYGMMGIEQEYVDSAEAWYNGVMDNLEAICTGLDEAACERIEYLAYSLWIGAVFVSQDFMMSSMGGGDQAYMMQMMMEREQILLWTFKQAIPNDETRLYAHMGAAHASKGGWNVAGQLDKFHATTKDQVYTVTPAYGPGSAIFYGYSSQALPADPQVLGPALADMPEDRYFLSTGHPGLDCTENPFVDYPNPALGGVYGDSWDSFFFYRKLTADNPGGWWYAGNSAWQSFFGQQMERLQYAQELMAEAHRLH